MPPRIGRNSILCLLCLAVAVLSSACGAGDAGPPPADSTATPLQTFVHNGPLGTVSSVSLYTENAAELVEQLFAQLEAVDAQMSANRPESELSRLNAAAGTGPVSVSPELYGLLATALHYAELAAGAFDPSIGAVMELWQEEASFARLPESTEIAARLPLVDYQQILLQADGQVELGQAGLRLDLGAIAKGYACDLLVEYLRAHGVDQALLDLGGNIYALGTKADGNAWQIGLKAPFSGDNSVVLALDVSDLAVVTSGGYERYFTADGRTYHHLLDPATGYPVENGLAAVTILAPSATVADALSTACFVLGDAHGLALVESQAGVEAVFIFEDRTIQLSSGLEAQISYLNPAYRLLEAAP